MLNRIKARCSIGCNPAIQFRPSTYARWDWFKCKVLGYHIEWKKGHWALFGHLWNAAPTSGRMGFLHQIIIGYRKGIYYTIIWNAEQHNYASYTKWDGKVSRPIDIKRNIHDLKVMLYILLWWDMKEVIYYEFLKPGEIIYENHYRRQLIKLKQAIHQKCPE